MSDVEGVGPLQRAQEARMKAQQADQTRTAARQAASKASFTESVEEAFNPFAADKEIQFKSLRERLAESQKPGVDREALLEASEEAGELAEAEEHRNWELKSRKLRDLRHLLLSRGADLTAEEVLAEVLEAFEDPALADEALDYLYETTYGKTKEEVAEAQDRLHERFAQEVKSGRNMGPESREYAHLDTPQSLRNLYRSVTGDPRTGNQLFQELSGKYAFDKLKEVVEFLLRSLGADLRAKGPSIPRSELTRLMTETRVLQSILGLYGFFLEREGLIRKLFEQSGIPFQERLEFESLAQHFIELVDERYPTTGKIYSIGRELGIDENIIAQIIVFTQYRDAIRGVAPRIYRSLEHRYEMLMALIEALDELEDQLEEEEEE